jgi:hypothetical protein
MSVAFIRKLADGRVVEKGTAQDEASFAELQQRAPGEYRIDLGDTPLSPIPAPVLPPQPQRNNYPSVEELTDALLKHLDGDVSAFTAIRAKLKK